MAESGRSTSRRERDSMGELEVPAGAYYGASTMRAKLNFPISPLRLPRDFIRALGLIKRQAALVNTELGLLDGRLSEAIAQAAQEVADGRFDAEFVVDVFQTGSGTSTNMNANEVIGNRAIEQPELHVDDRGLALDQAQRPDEVAGEAQRADREVESGPHRAGAVVGAGGNLELAHGVALAAGGRGIGAGHQRRSLEGTMISNSAPSPGSERALALPLWRSATVLTM